MMKNIIHIGIVFMFQFLVYAAYAQPSGTYFALNQFLGTDFFKQYNEMKNRAEQSVRDFKAIQSRYTEAEVEVVKEAYNSSAEYFNKVLVNIQEDMLHKEKRVYLMNYPESYSKQIEADLYRAKEFYANTYQKEVTNLTNGEISGVAILTLLPQAIKYATLAMEVIKKIKAEIVKFNTGLLDQYLIKPYSFRSWDEI